MILFAPDDEYPRAVKMGMIISSRTESSLKSGDSNKEKSKFWSGAAGGFALMRDSEALDLGFPFCHPGRNRLYIQQSP